MGFDDTGEGAFVGDSDGVVVEVAGAFDQLVGMGGSAEEGEVSDAVEFGVGHDKASITVWINSIKILLCL